MSKPTALPAPCPATMEPSLSWEWFLVEHDRWLRTVVASRVGERQAVDEVMQDLSLALCGSATPPSATANPAGWLYRLAVRKALLYRRSCGRRSKLVDRYATRTRDAGPGAAADPLAWLLLDERDALVRESLGLLPGRDREILLLKYTEGWSCRDLAARLGQTEAAIVARLHRARARLRTLLIRCDVVEVQP